MMKHKLLGFIMVLVCFFAFAIQPVQASAQPSVVDDGNLLTESQKQQLKDKIQAVFETYNIDILILTTKNNHGKSAQQYAEDYYEQNGYGAGSNHNGIVYLISMDTREYWITAYGTCDELLTTKRFDKLENHVTDYLSSGSYYQSFDTFVSDMQTYLKQGNFDLARELKSAGIGLVAGILIAFGVTYPKKKKLHSVKEGMSAKNITHPGDFVLSGQHDRFVSTNTTRVPIPKNPPKSSSSHSSGGYSSSKSGRGGHF